MVLRGVVGGGVRKVGRVVVCCVEKLVLGRDGSSFGCKGVG